MSLFGSIARAAVGFVAGGPAGAAASVARDLATRGRSSAAPVPMIAPRAPLPQPGTGRRIALPFAGPARGPGTAVVPRQQMAPVPMTGSSGGYHLNKSDYFLRDGTFVPKGTRWVKNRRRNPLNPRALSRAIARVDSGKTWQSKLREIETAKHTKAGSKKK